MSRPTTETADNPPTTSSPVTVTVRYFAAARSAAGVSEESAPGGLSLDELTDALAGRHGERLASVLKVASFLVDGVVRHDRQQPLPPNATVDVLPPFAGG